MWILETEGDALNGKKLWLRPGKKFLFGRTQAEEGQQFVVSDKTISRKHLTVEVSQVQPGDCENTRSRSRVTLTDLGTKIGTLVNGEQIRGKSFVLQTDNNVVALGKYKHHFHFTWVPVTLTFSFAAKELKANPYAALYNLLGPLDIKVLTEYERGVTTHLVAKKRNTSKGLQALIDGKFIVHNDSFYKAIVTAATSDGTGPSPLEENFEANFPDPLKFLPPKGDEPTERGETAYAPNPNRQDMFDGYTFVFYEQRQHSTLFAPISEGHGKVLLREVIPDETTVDDFVRYVKDVAGEKGLGEFEDGSEGKGVVVVRFNPVKGVGSEWFADFSRQVAQYLDHRLIEQNEFLDAILGNDASVLRRPLLPEPSGIFAPPPTAATPHVSSQAIQSSIPAPTPAPIEMAPPETGRRGRSRRMARTQFKGFDDDFSGPINFESVPESMEGDKSFAAEPESQSLFVSQTSEMAVDREASNPPETQTRTSRKRRAPSSIIEEEDIMDQIAPTAAAQKRRRLADEAARRRRGESPPPAPIFQKKKTSPPEPAPKKAKREINVLEHARQQREKAEALEKAERETLQEQLQGTEVEKMRDLAIIEEVEVKRRAPPSRAVPADESERWDDKWNGRKNYKKFRRQGAGPGNARDNIKVIVQLEEVKQKDFGIGDDYWDAGDSQRKSKKKDKGKAKETQSQDISQVRVSQGKNTKSRAAERAAQILANEAEEEMDRINDVPSSSDVEIVDPPPKAPEKLKDKTSTSQNVPPTTSNKRAAATTLTKPAPAKKLKQTVMKRQASEEDSDDDELKFRFKKRV